MTAKLKLISHKLCPYVQRAVIALTEKGVPFERVDIDLDNKPDWFLKISPLGKTPVLVVGDTAIFESAVILEYLEETQPNALHPRDALARAEHRGWIEFSSAVLADIWSLEVATDQETFAAKAKQLEGRLRLLEQRLVGATWAHAGNGWMFGSTNGGWEYPLYLSLLAVVQVLLGDGVFALSPSRPLPLPAQRTVASHA